MVFRLYFYIGYYAINLLTLKDKVALIVTLPMFFLVLLNVSRIKDKYFTVQDIISLLIYLFFVIEPLQMIDHGRIGVSGPVSRVVYTNVELVTASSIALVFYAIFIITTNYLSNPKVPIKIFLIEDKRSIFVFISTVFAFSIFVWLKGGFSGVFASRYERLAELQSQTSENAIGALIMVCAGVITMGATILAALTKPRLNLTLIYFIISISIVLICFNPFNTSRFALLSAYVPIVLVFTRGEIRAIAFYVASMIGVVVIFPILNITTRFGVGGLAEHREEIATDILSIKFMDIYDLLAECVRYVNIHGHDYGEKLFANLVSFVPRVWWPEKPVIGGLDIGYEMFSNGIFGTANVSQMIAADGYMDFGFFGVSLVAVLVGIFVHTFVFKRRYIINGHNLFGYIFIAALPILLRGPLTAVYLTFLAQVAMLMIARKLWARELPLPDGTRPSGVNAAIPIRPSGKATGNSNLFTRTYRATHSR
ncbi:O-antigen polymerase [Hephaestia sp. GCM10023244]|uniref:O-antigen polymerase n=1 Tax=unclassified Hephaestia TaxID=2631281 RepID=UPI0020772447|nr:O-antigen polymerase [Hephaestia sp. MAHUQ-44]MCM8732549.1 oligosaccharide repeat unit polymerase [Hephaestia sp. MAHUQ-44]